MSESYEFHLFKRLDAAGRPSLEPFFRMFWEHGMAFTPTLLAEPRQWSQACQDPSVLHTGTELRNLPLREAVAYLDTDGGGLSLCDKQMSYDCWVGWITSPAGQSLLSLRLVPAASALKAGINLGWYNATDSETFLLANYQQGMASFLHWSALCCQWFEPELAGSYEWRDISGYHFPEELLAYVDKTSFPSRAEWGWMMYLPASRITASLLEELVQSPELTIHSLMPVGLQVVQLPSRFHYETRAGYEMKKEPMYHALRNVTDNAEAEQIVRAEALRYQRALILFQAAHDAQGESLARLNIEQAAQSIEQIRNTPTLEEIERQAREYLTRDRDQRQEGTQEGT